MKSPTPIVIAAIVMAMTAASTPSAQAQGITNCIIMGERACELPPPDQSGSPQWSEARLRSLVIRINADADRKPQNNDWPVPLRQRAKVVADDQTR